MIDPDQGVEIGQAFRRQVVQDQPATSIGKRLHGGEMGRQRLQVGVARIDNGDSARFADGDQGIGGLGTLEPGGIDRFEQGRIVVRHHASIDQLELILVGVIDEIKQKLPGHGAGLDFFRDQQLAQQENSVCRLHLDKRAVGQFAITLDERFSTTRGFDIGVAIEITIRSPG